MSAPTVPISEASHQILQQLVEQTGQSMADVLDQALEQLASAFPEGLVGPDQVRAQFHGLGEQKVWDLCDRALTGRIGEALARLKPPQEQPV